MAKSYPKLAGVLKRLLYLNDMNVTDLARAVNMQVPTLHRIVTGKSTYPNKASLMPLAAYFNLDMKQLLGEESLPEESLLANELGSDDERNIVNIPVYLLQNVLHERHETNILQTIPYRGAIGPNAYATYVTDSAMEPVFPVDSILICDPNVRAYDRNFVLVHLKQSNQVMFRQLIIDSDVHYLKSLNQDLQSLPMRSLQAEDKIIAVLIEARQRYYHGEIE